MRFVRFFVQRPVFTMVLMLILVIAGALSFSRIAIRHLPDISQPVINIATDYDGASPELVEKEITIPIENVLSGIPGVENINSSSKLGRSYVNLYFKMGVDINEAANDIRNKMSALHRRLPTGSEAPAVKKNDSEASPVVIIGFEDQNRDVLEISDYLTRYVTPAIQEVPGAGEVHSYGARNYAIKIALDPVKMAARNLTVADVKKSLKDQNINIPSGQIKSKNRYYTVVTQAKLEDARRFSQLVVARKKNHNIRLSEIATVKVGNEKEDSYLRINGQTAVGLAIVPQSTANPIEVAKAVRDKLNFLKSEFPKGLKASVIFDASLYIKQSIYQVLKTFLEAIAFVALVVFLFLGDLRSTLIPVITIPICLIASLLPMQWLGFELNTLTMLAMVLAIGLVVDDAIVVLENCHRHLKTSSNKIQAAIAGSSEISFAVIAMTLTLAAVYAPMGFVQGFTGKLFLQFGVTLSIAVLISGLVALTLSPMMCSRLLSHHSNRYQRQVKIFFHYLSRKYLLSLDKVINKKFWLALPMVFLMLGGLFCFKQMDTEVAPVEDQSYLYVPVSSPTNSSTEYTDFYARQLEEKFKSIPENDGFLISVYSSGAFSMLKIKPWEQRQRSQQNIARDLGKEMNQIIGVKAYPISPNPLGRGNNNNQLSFALLSNSSYQQLNEISDHLVENLSQLPEFKRVSKDLTLDSEQININIDRQRAADLQVSLNDIADLLSTMIGGQTPLDFYHDGRAYKVVVQVDEDQKQDISVLHSLYVQNQQHKMIPLSSLIHVERSIGPESLPHYDRMRSAMINIDLNEKVKLGNAINTLNEHLENLLPQDVHYRFTDTAKDFLESSGNSSYAFILALIFIYMVLAAQFESFRSPFIVLSTVPLCLLGALFSLWLFKGSLNIYSNIGMVTLIGLISKHGIMMTEFANQLRERGLKKMDAIKKSAAIRLRPILMTTLAMALGALPLVFASGAGSESRSQLGLVIFGGLLIGTFFSLYVVPLAYLLFAKKDEAPALTAKAV